MRSVLTADRLIDGTGHPPLPHAALVIEDGRVEGIATGDDVDAALEGADRVDVAGGSILPGFVEMHTHMHCSAEADPFTDLATDSHEALLLRSARAMRLALGSGVTTLRDLGSRNEVAFAVRQAVRDGIIPGPHILVAGTPITTTGGHCHMFGTEANSAEQVVAAVRGQVKRGADWIKIMATGGRFTPRTNPRQPQYPVDTLRAAVEDAARLEVRVAAHCHAAAGVRNAVEAGVRNLVHATWLSPDPDAGYEYDPDVAEMMAEKGLFVDPTVATLHLRNAHPSAHGPNTDEREKDRSKNAAHSTPGDEHPEPPPHDHVQREDGWDYTPPHGQDHPALLATPEGQLRNSQRVHQHCRPRRHRTEAQGQTGRDASWDSHRLEDACSHE